MTSFDLALTYVDSFYGDGDLETVADILAADLIFEGPLFSFDSADAYLASLREEPPAGMQYDLINSFADGSSVCLLYRVSKAGISTPMAPLFEITNGKISKILLIFDSGPFRQ